MVRVGYSQLITLYRPAMARPLGIRDETDRQLLALLQLDARQSTTGLAKRLGMARSTIHAPLPDDLEAVIEEVAKIPHVERCRAAVILNVPIDRRVLE